MKTFWPLAIIGIFTPAPSFAAAQPKCWSAVSTTAMAITGDICLSANRISFGNGASLPIRHEANNPAFPTDFMGNQPAEIFKTVDPQEIHLLNGNNFQANWIAIFLSNNNRDLYLEIFEGDTIPASFETMTGSFSYSR